MASISAKAIRRADALGRLSKALGITQADLQINGRGDPELALIITLERIADAVESKTKTANESKAVKKAKSEADAPLTVETVEVVPDGESKPKGESK